MNTLGRLESCTTIHLEEEFELAPNVTPHLKYSSSPSRSRVFRARF